MTKSSKKDTSKAAGAGSTPGPGPAGKLTPGKPAATTTSTTTTTALNIKADIRNALISLLESDDEHMAGIIISAISVVIVEKLAQKGAECLVQSGFNETVKQDVYEACDMNLKKA